MEVRVLADPIAGLRSPKGALVSVYLNRPSPGGFSALISDLLRPLRERSESMSRTIQKSVRRDVDRIHELAGHLEMEPAPAFAIFASDEDDIFVVKSLTHAVESKATMGPRPYLRPLRAGPRPLRAGVVVADRTGARTFTVTSEHLEELGEPIRGETGKPNFGGFSGYDEYTVRARADEVSARIWREAGIRLFEEHQRQPFDFLVVGSQEAISEEIVDDFHPYLADLYRTSLPLNPKGLSPASLRSGIQDLAREVRANRQLALAGRVLDTAWSGGQAALGLTKAIEAANAQAVDVLVVAGWFSRMGVVCSVCGALGRTGNRCQVCGGTTLPVDDVVSELMDTVVAAGGSVHQIEVASPLDNEGVGVLTRYPVKV